MSALILPAKLVVVVIFTKFHVFTHLLTSLRFRAFRFAAVNGVAIIIGASVLHMVRLWLSSLNVYVCMYIHT